MISKKKEKKKFDAVICCNGKYSVPYMIELPGLCSFTGNCIHSHNYRSEEPYKDRTVLVIGGGPSGIDICNHLTKVAKKVIHTRQTRIKKIFDNCSQRTSTNSWHNHGFSIFLLRMKLTRFLISS